MNMQVVYQYDMLEKGLALCLYKQTPTSINNILSYIYRDQKLDAGIFQRFNQISKYIMHYVTNILNQPVCLSWKSN